MLRYELEVDVPRPDDVVLRDDEVEGLGLTVVDELLDELLCRKLVLRCADVDDDTDDELDEVLRDDDAPLDIVVFTRPEPEPCVPTLLPTLRPLDW